MKTTRRGLDVRARSGYTAPAAADPAGSPAAAGSLPPPVREALTGLLPAAEAPLDVNAATFAVPGARTAAVVLTVGVGAFAALPVGAAAASRGGPLEIVATVLDQDGRQKGIARQALELSWPASVAAGERRFDALSRLDLAPGEYEVRVAVAGAARTASVFAYVTVPAFDSTPLSLSNIVVGATPGTLTAPREFLSALLPVVPTAQREFAQTDRLVAFFRIYQGTARQDPLSPVQLQSTIVDARGTVVATETSTLDAAKFASGRTADHYLTIPLATLAQGEYLLRVETTMGAGWQDAPCDSAWGRRARSRDFAATGSGRVRNRSEGLSAPRSRSVRHARRSRGLKCGGIPLELSRKPREPAVERAVARGAVLLQHGLDTGDREQAGNARHAELAQHRPQLHRCPDTAELARRVTDDCGWAPEILFEEVIEQVAQCGRDAVIVFTGDDDEGVGGTIRRGQPLERRRCRARGVSCTCDRAAAAVGSPDRSA